MSTRKRALELIAKPTFKDYTVYNEKLAGIHLDPSVVKLDKPSYVGVAVLGLLKVYMYRFHYEDVKARYGDRAKLLFTDTDSLCYHIETEDWYDDIREDVQRSTTRQRIRRAIPQGYPERTRKLLG